jgi:hypothetical protein
MNAGRDRVAASPFPFAVRDEDFSVSRIAEQVKEASCFRPGTLVLTARGLEPIEQITLGRRILPFPDDLTPPTSINPFDYRQIHLQIAKDGKLFDMRFLRPARLFEGLGAGDLINLKVLELELEGRATVLSIDPCPSIEEGPGNIVTGAFSGQTVNLKRLKLKDLAEPIETTGNHPFFSEDHLAFVAVNHLQAGTRLRTRGGITEIESITEFPGRWDVFNLEVDGAHQFYVTDQRVLVHNGNGILPSVDKISIDMEEVLSGHTEEGIRAVASGKKSLFVQMSERAIVKR